VSEAAADPIAAWAVADGAYPSVVEDGAVTTRAALNDQVNRVTGGLAALGVRPGECAVWCGPNGTEVVVAMHAFRRLGLVAVPLPYRFTAEECHHVLSDSGAVVVLADAGYAPLIAGLAPSLPDLRHVVSFGGACGGVLAWADLAALGSMAEPPAPAENGTAMMYTSGTTGRPKGAIRGRSDRALLGAMMAELNFGATAAPAGAEVHLVTGPLYHAGPNAFALLTHISGGTLVMMRSFDAAEWLRLVAERRVTSAFVAPTHLKRIVALPDDVLAAAEVSSLRTLIVNAAPVPYALKREVVAKLGEGFLYEVYGSTELGIATVLRPEDQLRKPGSCGRPYGGIELRVVGDDGGAVPTGQPGELFVRTALAIDGYHRAAGRLAELPGGWKSVGDVAWLDDEGYLHICDRKADMVITGGMNVYPAEVEGVLHAHPDVADAAVIGVPDAEWGERVHAVVQPKAGRDVDPSELETFVARRLAGYKRPRSWDVRAQLPRTESGKLLKRLLRAEHAEHAEQAGHAAGGRSRP